MKTTMRIVYLGVLFSILAASPASAVDAKSAKVSLDMPQQRLEDALSQLALKANLKLVYYTELGDGLKSPAINGTFTAEAALKQLLANSGLRFEYLDQSTVAIRSAKEGNSSSDARPADQMRVAIVDEADKGKAESPEDSTVSGSGRNQMIVEGERDRIKPYTDANADIPRTMNDAQPYYIFDSETIERSGAINIEDFLKQRLTMNAVAQTNGQKSGQSPNLYGNTSTVDLRGLGADKTLVLVNGRRKAAVNINLVTFGADLDHQADISGIPLSAIDRIEVLPSSASGIYGGSAIGGVVNVILKRDYSGGDLRVTYDDTWDMASPHRTVSGSYGLALEGGRTHLSANLSWSDSEPMLLRDRASILRRNLDDIQGRVPDFIMSDYSPWLGSLPNIQSADGTWSPDFSVFTPLPLVFDGGTELGSSRTHVAAGTSSGTPVADLRTGLQESAGAWNLEFPLSTQSPTGLLQALGSAPRTRAAQVGIRRQMFPQLELFAEISFDESRSESIFNPFVAAFRIPGNAPSNPFESTVLVSAPDGTRMSSNVRSESFISTIGAMLHLPHDWTGLMDYTWSKSSFSYSYFSTDYTAIDAHLLSGELNPFVDTLMHPLDLRRYTVPNTYSGSSDLHDFTMRASGPLPALPWGAPNITGGLERRISKTPQQTARTEFPITVADNSLTTYFERKSVTDSGYLEFILPLLKKGWLPGVHSLDLQASGRFERYAVDTGTAAQTVYYNQTPQVVSYIGTIVDEQPYFSRTSYTSNNHTVGFKYQPVEEITLRFSRATAFIPPSPTQLLDNPVQSTFRRSINDPTTPGPDPSVYTRGGGNPDLEPQNSRSLNAGIIWEPHWRRLSGLRLNAEYYRIEQFGAIATLTAQQIVDEESTFPDRVIRDANGVIVLVDTSMLNLFRRDTEGWDLSASYAVNTAAGRFNFSAFGSAILGLENQYSRTLSTYDSVDFPSEGGAAKYKGNATINWEREKWTLGWTARYFSSYRAHGAAGGPYSTQRNNGAASDFYILRQGSDAIPSQVYHDVYFGYDFGAASPGFSRALNGVRVQLKITNVFDEVPPMDAYYESNFYLSPYGDTRLRAWSVSLQKAF